MKQAARIRGGEDSIRLARALNAAGVIYTHDVQRELLELVEAGCSLDLVAEVVEGLAEHGADAWDEAVVELRGRR